MYFLKHENVLHAEYVKTAGSAGEGVVVRPDRKVLQDYLKNEKFFEKATADAIKKIDKSVRIPVNTDFCNVYETEMIDKNVSSSGNTCCTNSS